MQTESAGPETIHDTPAVKRSHAAAQKVCDVVKRVVVNHTVLLFSGCAAHEENI